MPSAPPAGVRRRVVVADDDVLLREGIASLLGEAGYDVIERAGEARTLVDAVLITQPGQQITWGELHVGSRSIFADAGFARNQQTHTQAGRDADRLLSGQRVRA